MMLLLLVASGLSAARGGLGLAQPGLGQAPRKPESPIRIISSDEKGLVFVVEFPASKAVPETVNNRVFLRFPGAEDGPPGEPGLPRFPVSFAVPRGKTPRITARALEQSSFPGPPPLPYPRYTEDGLTPVYEAVDVALPYPGKLVDVGGVGLMRHVKTGKVVLYPYSYEGGRYIFRKKIRVRISFVDTSDGLVPFSGYDPFEGIYGINLINWQGQDSWKAKPKTRAITGPFGSALAWVKASVSTPGIYEVSYEDMEALGLDRALLSDPNALAVFSLGNDTMRSGVAYADTVFRQIPCRVDDGGDGVFGPGDRVLFYAEGIPDREWDSAQARFDYWNNPYTDTVVYWVAVGYTGAAQRAQVRDVSPRGGVPLDSHISYAHHEENAFVPGQKGVGWVGEILQLPTSASYADYDFTLQCENVADGTGEISVSMVGNAETPTGNVSYQVFLNGQYTGEFSTTANARRVYTVSVSGIKEGDNTVTLELQRTDSNYHEAYLDYIDLSYAQKDEYGSEESLFFPGTPEGFYRITGQGPRPVFLWDVSDPFAPVVLRNFQWSDGSLELSDSAGPGKRIYLSTFARKPEALSLLDLSVNLWDNANHADYLICGPDALQEPARALVQWRRDHLWLWNDQDSSWNMSGGDVMFVRLEDVYDQFGFGLRDPVAIRNFYYYVYNYWQEPQITFFLNLGDGHYDYKNYTGTPGNMFPPWNPNESYSLNSGPWTLEDFYFDFDDDGSVQQDAFYGRLPARTKAEAWDYVNKLKRYERGEATGPWRDRVLLVPDDEHHDSYNEYFHTEDVDSLQRGHIPRTVEVRHAYGVEYPMEGGFKPDWTADFIKYFNEGNLLITMFVHGSPTQITDERLYLLTRDRDLINAGPRNPLIMVLSCKVGIFERLDPPHCIGEDWTINSGGAIGVISTTASASAGANKLYAMSMYDILSDGKPHPASEVEAAGKNHEWYYLCGEPGVPIKFPQVEMSLSGPDTLTPGQKASFSGSGASGPVVYPLALDARYTKYKRTLGGYDLYFESEDWPEYRGALSAPGSFNLSFTVPRDAREDTTGARVLVFDPAPPFGKLAIKDNLYTSSWQGSSDISGPEISFWINGEELASGGVIPVSGSLEFRLSDPSGIYLRPKETPDDAASILVAVDDRDFYDVTTSFQYDRESDTSGFGFFEYDFSENPGVHTLGLRAYDNQLNQSNFTLSLNATEPELSLEDALPVPNPYTGGKLYFTYRVNQQARVRVLLYTITGKLVWDSGERLANPGVNYITYTGPEAANGLYFVVTKARRPGDNNEQKIVEKLLITR